jgi:acyl-CoA synthetase (AMP-forming)/AMP-acid ligase II
MNQLTVGDLLERGVRLYPNKTATWYQGEAQSFADFHADVLAFQAHLARAGLERGDRVAVLSRNNPSLLRVLFAAALGGYVFVPINFRLTAKEVAFVVGDCGAQLLFTDSFFLDTAQEAVAAVAGFPAEGLVELNQAFVERVRAAGEQAAEVAVGPEDLFGIYYTSGTTGNPKGVMLSHANMVAGVINHTITYGLTEAAPLITYLPREQIRIEPEQVHRLASVGKDMYLNETRVVDDDGNEVGVDALGEIVARGANVMQGYWNRPEETAKTLKNGWLHTGDIGRRDAEGYLYIVDRKKDLIISGGENISPREVEEVIFAHPKVSECSVFGIPDPRWGEAVALCDQKRAACAGAAVNSSHGHR